MTIVCIIPTKSDCTLMWVRFTISNNAKSNLFSDDICASSICPVTVLTNNNKCIETCLKKYFDFKIWCTPQFAW